MHCEVSGAARTSKATRCSKRFAYPLHSVTVSINEEKGGERKDLTIRDTLKVAACLIHQAKYHVIACSVLSQGPGSVIQTAGDAERALAL